MTNPELLNELERLRAENEENKRLVELMSRNEQLGCYTRQAFDHIVWPDIRERAAWVVFFDVDGMKQMNSTGGWMNTSAIVNQSISIRSSDYIFGQVLSGDEFVVVILDRPDRPPVDPMKFCERLLRKFRNNGASATFAFRKVDSVDLEENLKPIMRAVMEAKNDSRRGTITRVK